MMVFLPIPAYQEILLMTVLLALINAVAYRYFVNPAKVKGLKEEIKSYRDKMKAAQKANDKDEMMKFLNKMNEKNMEQAKMMMGKPMILSMGLFLLPLWFVFPVYFANLALTLPFPLPEISGNLAHFEFHFSMASTYNWFWWYLIIIIPSSLLFRKMLGVQ